MAIYEHSAGGVVYRTVDGALEILLIQDKNNKWTFPKGLIDKKEDAARTAEREVLEEAGLHNLVYVGAIDTIGYFYRFRENLVQKKVDYFLFEYEGREKPKAQREEGIKDARWFTPQKALAMIGYEKTNKPVLEKALIWIGKKHQI